MNTIRSMEKHFGMLASAVTGYNVSVHLIKSDNQVGYTVMPVENKADITLSYTSNLYSGLPDDMIEFYMMGVLAHECMHLVYTNFDAINSRVNALGKNSEKELFRNINNIAEDPAIEFASKNKVGGPMLKALNAIIAHTWKTSPDISREDPVLKQVLSALIQKGDRGKYKGNLSDEAVEVYNRIIPLFNSCIIEPDGQKRVDYSTEMYKILEEYLPEEDETSSDAQLNTPLPKAMGQGETLPETMSPQDISQDSGSAQLDAEKSDGTPESTQSVEKSEDADDEVSEADLQALKSILDATETEIAAEERFKEVLKRKAAEDIPDDTDEVTHERIERGNQSKYEKLIETYSVQIHTLAQDLSKIFSNDRTRLTNTNRGSRLNVKRLASPVLHEDVLLRRNIKKNLGDIAVYMLIDSSGSMSSSRNGRSNISEAFKTAACLFEALKQNKIPVFVTGFSTRGPSAFHRDYVTWHSTDGSPLTRLVDDVGNCNMDYYSIKDAANNLKKQPARHKILFVISDGMPCSSSRVRNPIEATEDAVKSAKKISNVLGVAMNPEDEEKYKFMYGKDYITVKSVDDMFLLIGAAFRNIVKSW